MASLSSLGIGSGIDTATMLEQIKAGEQTRLKPYTIMQNSYKLKVSAWGGISSSLSALQGSVKKLTSDAFNTLTVSSNKAFTATATSEANADTHSVTISQLATAHKIKTGGEKVEDADAMQGESNGGTRTITITTGDGKTTKVELKDDETSLNQIAKAVNKQDSNVSASVQRTDDGYQLVFTSKNTGSDGKMSVSVEGDDALAGKLNYKEGDTGNGMQEVTKALDAKLTVDGSDYTRSSNNISDIITGVTLVLKQVSESDPNDPDKKIPEQMTLTRDTSAIKSSVKDFVEKYNALLKLTSEASKYVPNKTAGLSDSDVATQNAQNGALMGDSTLRGMVGDFRSAVNGVYGDPSADYGSLADIGVKIDPATGQMTLNESKLDEAIADNPDGIADMFIGRGEKEGLATSLSATITEYLGDPDTKTDGIIKTSTEGLDAQIKLMDTQIEKTQKLIDNQVERYRVQFQNLDTTMSKLNSMSNQLSSILATL
ncbi:flagellar filament capping protein FliD [Yersinia mollaretii]|uniref:flagellar filament capping protein FliD n=1 Tax=Yersinia mollaretii TaxID=33060 RepID=UPI0005DAD41B|nr:flagellar filament capping protein FliD [Yersinia mollaretii]MDA5528385.1 flagellar filament capping protein FliD [Yersinia mollaretii]MDR7874352.1 flagellar filament capping protein FliD [Yersinia mollaretii]PHZ32470.1 flagellar cap protein [Yersinia mollaretii]WQC74712.1 flagellar filament capping protein FliD [Yersinia mollaretii]CNE63883.1 flagellar capping protein [Yersinia mollaretii]